MLTASLIRVESAVGSFPEGVTLGGAALDPSCQERSHRPLSEAIWGRSAARKRPKPRGRTGGGSLF